MVQLMQSEKAAVMKRDLRKAAEEIGLDLSFPENGCTFWTVNGAQGYLCWSQTSTLAQLDLQTLLQQFWPDSPTILDVTGREDRVIVLSTQVG